LELAGTPYSVKIMPTVSAARPSGPLVCVLVYDGLCTFEFGVAAEVFALPRPEMGSGWYRYAVCGVEPGPLRAAGGLTVTPEDGLERLAEADLVVVPGWRGIDAPVPATLIRALQAAHARGARLMSLCSGVAVLAAAGLLAGRAATTHWRYADAVAARWPDIRLDPGVLYVDHGDVATAAGSAARHAGTGRSPRRSTCACMSCGAISARRRRTPWRVGWWFHPTARGDRRSSCPRPFRAPTRPAASPR
jgi:AraC family transcriptional regulator, transcriptional activator FtrA